MKAAARQAVNDTGNDQRIIRTLRLYRSRGAGFIDVVQQREDTYEELARIPTTPGARTALFVPERDRLCLAVRASGSEGAAVWIFRPAP
jgi:hypothetical protein